MSATLKLTIDGQPVSITPGETILQAARRLGISIPTLCHVEGFLALGFLFPVRGSDRGAAQPLAVVRHAGGGGMVVTTDSDEVRSARKTALELLISDHAGDCVGPCKTGCPARLDIPNFIAQIAAGDHRKAAEIVTDDLTLPPRWAVCVRGSVKNVAGSVTWRSRSSIRNLPSLQRPITSAAPARLTCRAKAEPTGKRVAIVGAGRRVWRLRTACSARSRRGSLRRPSASGRNASLRHPGVSAPAATFWTRRST